jgi:hypothetical protein
VERVATGLSGAEQECRDAFVPDKFIVAVAVALWDCAIVVGTVNGTLDDFTLVLPGLLLKKSVNVVLNALVGEELVGGDINLAVAVLDIFGLRAEPLPDTRVFEIVCVEFSIHADVETEDDIHSLERGGGRRC